MTDDTPYGRLPLLEPAELTAAQRAVYDALAASRGRSDGGRPTPPFRWADDDGRLLGPFNALLYSPPVGLPLQELGAALRFRTAFTPRERELATLAVAGHQRSAYEWYAHERIGRGAGLTEDELAALRAGRRPVLAEPRERVVVEVARMLAAEGDLDDARYDEAVAVLGRPLLVELVTLVGYYTALALQLRVFRVGPPPGAPDVEWDTQMSEPRARGERWTEERPERPAHRERGTSDEGDGGDGGSSRRKRAEAEREAP